MTCETCRYWARQGNQFLTNHHPYCPHIVDDLSDRQKLDQNPDLLEQVCGVIAMNQLLKTRGTDRNGR